MALSIQKHRLVPVFWRPTMGFIVGKMWSHGSFRQHSLFFTLWNIPSHQISFRMCVVWFLQILTMRSVEEFKTNESDLNYFMEIYWKRISLLLLALYIPKCAKDFGLNKTSLKNHRKVEPTKNGKLLLWCVTKV